MILKNEGYISSWYRVTTISSVTLLVFLG